MNFPRYFVAGGVSLALHASLLLVVKQSTALAMPAGNQSTSVAINFVAAPQATPQVKADNIAKSPAKPEPKTTPVTPEKPTGKVAQSADKPKPTAKTAPQKPIRSASNKAAQAPKTVAPPVKQKSETTQAVTHTEPAVTPARTKPTPAVSSQGANAAPILIDRPSFVSRPIRPNYPRLAQKRGIEGVATYEVWLDAQGRQIKQILISSSGTEMLDQSALDAIKQWKFSPHIINGEALAHRVQIPVRFRLDG
ncbi:energy transducer TonB [Vibrio fluvialis]|uniref:energy transducer TonB n=1 Tax=Vibrio TaxID=662 RepID=UPI00192A6FF3|nr:energy transducer TonB [Vibrio fluvialis]EMC0408027.1 energy transducer TonB [Vibrio fluvialis]MBL4239352.1 energy transducer TonB [Vibrio fluvialis]MBL4263355.1 energy transducer TonB [Vibrio fluvialis]MBL4267713.1 energy transducer TonB [Vibrio fluvialis]MBL4272697.1 energy transducer TonB [Vibrio fluvialis]